MASTTDGLVAITREFLASYYDKYPFQPLCDDVSRLTSEIRSLASEFIKDFNPSQDERVVIEEAESEPPRKIDENMWKNRQLMEEILYLLDDSRLPPQLLQPSTPEDGEIANVISKIRDSFDKTLKELVSFQAKISEHICNTVMTYLPKDFRGTLIRHQKERFEKHRQAEIDALVKSGASIRDRYALLWRQQMDRRRLLAQFGSATGVYRSLMKHIVGVPQALLDFIRTINDDDGPMEEQRVRYGPPLYCLTRMLLSIRLLLSLSCGWFEARKLNRHQACVLQQAVDVYTREFTRYITFLSEVLSNAPFFISAEIVSALQARKNDEFKEVSVPAGKTHEVMLVVNSVNSYIAWDFSLIQGKDIGFSVEYVDSSGQKNLILPYRRYESDKGKLCTVMSGSYKLIWDNSYSTFFKKVLRYWVDSIIPVV